ncbi:MAG TPA: riboflavin biosynthesis protein RibD, partial [Marmoricola sp.]|nr:riboflavin biosynthesis protein RibD [Marmoricola sp.]
MAQDATATEVAAMRRALELAALGPFSPNPRVGCVVLAPDGSTVAEGYHRGAGTAHAEADALDHAGDR